MHPTRILTALAAFAAATPALAHTGNGAHDLIHGFSHPFAGWDHFAAMLAVGLWAATRAPKQAWHAPAMFLGVLAVGGVGGLVLPGFSAEGIVAGSLFALAALLIVAPFIGNRAGLGLIGLFALAHGHAHGTEALGFLPAYFAGFIAASAALHLIGWKLGSAIFATRTGRFIAALGIGAAGIATVAA
ncbi:HupE/UreJ family protein [Croceicoccus gelatinilyticus]|uniref:HupE/UreJ family protein n=1 Tax=Croceicoccus gelatinilyticus TaxID=2835536 RepID=UPI001BCFF791|nr:HupE/UreJ family protein [Croceicoccus gelatinilyticus]MBS7669307.1 HupE/UreJ family protein [Croceicoccus gelatinilyticus]